MVRQRGGHQEKSWHSGLPAPARSGPLTGEERYHLLPKPRQESRSFVPSVEVFAPDEHSATYTCLGKRGAVALRGFCNRYVLTTGTGRQESAWFW